MKVVALLSGGKDSCFNACHCVQQGHELVALASLGPPGGKEELDSYMYQTVGQDGLHFIAQAMELPLYRHEIKGTAIDTSSNYAASDPKGKRRACVKGDETEDLFELLSLVKTHHPDIQAVSVGAILSNYQRVRVEHVCSRLGLQALAYLWQFDQLTLLQDMHDAGMECAIIKVAGAGLDTKHLGRNVCDPTTRFELERLSKKWGTHPAGEGGEYETFTLDCPLFKKRIQLLETEVVTLSGSSDAFGTVAYLRIKRAELVPKSPSSHAIRIPELLDGEATELYDSLRDIDYAQAAIASPSRSSTLVPMKPHSRLDGNWLSISHLQSDLPSDSIEDEVKHVFGILQEQLNSHDLSFNHISHINLYISSIELFASINAIYNTYFGPSPPTRACVAVPLPPGRHVLLDAMAHKPSSKERIALHVQGRSFWAPANIGPYSQCVIEGSRVFIAGQIGLIPATLTFPSPKDELLEAILSAKHVRSIVKAVSDKNAQGGGWDGFCQSCICWIADSERTRSKGFLDALSKIAEETFGDEVKSVFVGTTELPKGAAVEWQVVWNTARDQEGDSLQPSYGNSVTNISYDAQTVSTDDGSIGYLACSENSLQGIQWPSCSTARVFAAPECSAETLNQCLNHLQDSAKTVIPILWLYTTQRRDLMIQSFA